MHAVTETLRTKVRAKHLGRGSKRKREAHALGTVPAQATNLSAMCMFFRGSGVLCMLVQGFSGF